MYSNNIETLYNEYETIKEKINYHLDSGLFNINYFYAIDKLQRIIDNIEFLECVSFEQLKEMDFENG